MEMKMQSSPAWLDPNHPNYERWKRSRQIAIERGKFVKSIIDQNILCENLTVLDLGSGEGGTAKVLAGKNHVLSFDLSMNRLQRQREKDKQANLVNGDALVLPFKKNSFDLIILQDVIEHIPNNKRLLKNIYEVLKPDGIIYLSTPNRYSIFNIIADPHWGFPVIALMKRKQIKKYFLKYFRKTEKDRVDAAELLSLSELIGLFSDDYEFKLYTTHAVARVLRGDKGIMWSSFHLFLINAVNKLQLGKIVLRIANNEYKIINGFFSPSFYFILKKINYEST